MCIFVFQAGEGSLGCRTWHGKVGTRFARACRLSSSLTHGGRVGQNNHTEKTSNSCGSTSPWTTWVIIKSRAHDGVKQFTQEDMQLVRVHKALDTWGDSIAHDERVSQQTNHTRRQATCAGPYSPGQHGAFNQSDGSPSSMTQAGSVCVCV